MKNKFCQVSIINLKLMGMVAFAIGAVLSPIMAYARDINDSDADIEPKNQFDPGENPGEETDKLSPESGIVWQDDYRRSRRLQALQAALNIQEEDRDEQEVISSPFNQLRSNTCKKLPTFLPSTPAPQPPCNLNDKYLTRHDITSYTADADIEIHSEGLKNLKPVTENFATRALLRLDDSDDLGDNQLDSSLIQIENIDIKADQNQNNLLAQVSFANSDDELDNSLPELGESVEKDINLAKIPPLPVENAQLPTSIEKLLKSPVREQAPLENLSKSERYQQKPTQTLASDRSNLIAQLPGNNSSWFQLDTPSQLVALNQFANPDTSGALPEYMPRMAANNWINNNTNNQKYNLTKLIAILPEGVATTIATSSPTDVTNLTTNNDQLILGYNRLNIASYGRETVSNRDLFASLPTSNNPASDSNNFTPTLVPAPTPYISQFPRGESNSEVVKILAPLPDAVLDVAATTVIVQFPVGNEVELRVNGGLVDRTLIGRTQTDSETNLVTQTWYGVPLFDGENTISAQVIGSQADPTQVKVVTRGAAQSLTIETVEARIPADGRSTATIKGQLLDENGNLSNRDAIVTLAATSGEFTQADFKPEQPGFQVHAKSGQFTATLQSSLEARVVRIRAEANKLEAFTQLQFTTALRPSLVTGTLDLRLGARGTDFYSRFRDFLPEDEDNRTQLSARGAIFATGAIGEWLVTGAYDSDRALNEDCNCDNRLFGTYQFSEQNYPVYGDSSTVNRITPSTDSLYLRFERSPQITGADPDYLMWGDYHTEEFSRSSQQFTALTRQLHGFKTNYNFGNLQFTGFYGNNVEGFQRDTIPPDGTSGFYFLSQRLLVPGSENIFLELEELNRPGTVLQRQQLSRGPDYEIDYDRGTVIFREPILRTDVGENGEVLVRRIVVTYQYESQESDSNIYAGRLQYNLSRKDNQNSWLGATYIQENQGVRDFELYGADALISLGKTGRIVAEYARSRNDSDVMGNVEGEAIRAEAEAQIFKGLRARAYYRFADIGFANNATISFVPGQTRYGALVTGQVTPSTNLRFQYDHEDNFGIAPQPIDTFEQLLSPRPTATPGNKVDNSLTTISAGVIQRLGKANLSFDWLHREREDRLSPQTFNTTSDQLRSRLTFPLANQLTFIAQNELTLSSQTDAVFPDRTVLGLNWQAIPGINLSLTQQFYTRGQFNGNAITSFNINGEHKFGEDTTVTGRFSVLGGADGPTTQGALGLKQGINIASGLRLNLAYERVFGNFFGNNGSGVQFAQPFALGQSAAALGFSGGDSYSVGLEYTDNPNFKASARFEHRTSSGGSNTVISAGANGKITPSLTALLRYQQAGSSNQRLTGLGDTASLRVGLAYRDPHSDKFNALLRYEYRKNPALIPDTVLFGNGTGAEDHTFAVEAIYAPNWQWEFYGKYALRNSTSYLASDFVESSTINLGQLRATYRLGYSWDVVGEARLITQSNYTETGFVVETGYYLTPNLRLAGGYAFGKVDDRDFSGTRSAGGAYLGLTVKLNELFDGFGLQKVKPPQKQISLIEKLRQFKAEELKRNLLGKI